MCDVSVSTGNLRGYMRNCNSYILGGRRMPWRQDKILLSSMSAFSCLNLVHRCVLSIKDTGLLVPVWHLKSRPVVALSWKPADRSFINIYSEKRVVEVLEAEKTKVRLTSEQATANSSYTSWKKPLKSVIMRMDRRKGWQRVICVTELTLIH